MSAYTKNHEFLYVGLLLNCSIYSQPIGCNPKNGLTEKDSFAKWMKNMWRTNVVDTVHIREYIDRVVAKECYS